MNTISRRQFAKLAVPMTSIIAFPKVYKALTQTKLEMTDRKNLT